MDKITNIQTLYFEQGKTLTEIAETINTSISYISRVLKKDTRYTQEKERRKCNNLSIRRKVQKELIYDKRKNNIDIEYMKLKNQHDQATMELSKHSVLGKESLRKWCSSAYKYNSIKKRYEFDTGKLLKPADFPLYI